MEKKNNKLWHSHIAEYYSVIKMNKIMKPQKYLR